MGDNHPTLNIRGRVEEASQRLVQGCFVNQLARPYYGSITLLPTVSALLTSQEFPHRAFRLSADKCERGSRVALETKKLEGFEPSSSSLVGALTPR